MKKLLLMVAALLMLALPASADVTLPEGLTVIEPNAFAGCTELTGTLVIPDGVTEIGDGAFRGCTGLTELILPDSVTVIGDYAFAGCTELAGTVVGDGVDVGTDAFDGTNVEVTEPTPATEFTYTINADGTVTITGYIGQSENGVVVIPDTIEGGKVTEIGTGAFMQLAVTDVTLPAGLTTIGDNAFESCSSLTAVRGGRKVTSYGRNAFYYCTELKSMTINEDASFFGEYAFGYCENLHAMLCLSSESTFTWESFHGADIVALGFQVNGSTAALKQRFAGITRDHVTIPSSYKGLPVTEIICADVGNYACGLCYRLTIPSTVKKIGMDAMWGAHQDLTTVDFQAPSSLVEIGERAFCGLYELETIELPDTLKIIGNDAFKYDSSLRNLTIPDGLESLGESAFWFTQIPSVDIPSAWTEIPPYAFYGMALTEFTIPARITKLGQAALAGNTKLTSLVIPDTVQEVGAYTFTECTSLTEAVLPSHLTYVPTCAFANCTSLTNIELSDNIEAIEMAAFEGCTSLEYVELPPKVTWVLTCAFRDSGVRTKAVDRVVAECITSGMSDFEKALALHDWLINNADYSSTRTFFGAEGVLVYGEGVCQSYTDAYAMLLDKVGISHKAVVSSSMDHTWNLVQLDGEWYHVDVTWDDPVGGPERHIYFGLTDELMAQDHTWDNADSLPAATGTRYQYGVDNGN